VFGLSCSKDAPTRTATAAEGGQRHDNGDSFDDLVSEADSDKTETTEIGSEGASQAGSLTSID